MHIIFEVTHICPAKCPHCRITRDAITIDPDTFSRVVSMFKSLESSRYLLTISGGEPTALRNLHEYVDAARESGYTVTVATNGYNVRRLLRACPDFVQVSVDYFGKKHDENRGIELWENVTRIIKLIKKGGIEGFVRFTLYRDNLEDLKALHSFARPVPIIAMPVRMNEDRTPTIDQLKEASKYAILPSTCPVGKGQFVITPNLRCLDCIFTRNYVGTINPVNPDSFHTVIEKYAELEPYPCGGF